MIAIARVPAFDATVYHRLEIAAQASSLQVTVDGALINFFLSTGFTRTVPISATGGSNDGTVGIAFGATDSRGLIGGQRATNLIVSPYTPLGAASGTPKIAVTPTSVAFGGVTSPLRR